MLEFKFCVVDRKMEGIGQMGIQQTLVLMHE